MFADRTWLSQVPGSATPRGRRLEPIRVAPQSLMNLLFFSENKSQHLGVRIQFSDKAWTPPHLFAFRNAVLEFGAKQVVLVWSEERSSQRCGARVVQLNLFFCWQTPWSTIPQWAFPGLDIALGCLKWERDHPRECQGARFSQEKKREMKQKLTQSLVMTNECKGCGLRSQPLALLEGVNAIFWYFLKGIRTVMKSRKKWGRSSWNKRCDLGKDCWSKVESVSSDFIWLHHRRWPRGKFTKCDGLVTQKKHIDRAMLAASFTKWPNTIPGHEVEHDLKPCHGCFPIKRMVIPPTHRLFFISHQ